MIKKEIRDSLHYGTYLEHAQSLKLSADENNKLFHDVANDIMTEENRIKGLGLLRSALLLYAVSIELILKAIVLKKEEGNILSGEIKTFKQFLKRIREKKGTAHEFRFIIDKYQINFSKKELELIDCLQNYTVWAGRFPYPINEDKIKNLERNSVMGFGAPLSISYIDEIQSIIDSQISNLY